VYRPNSKASDVTLTASDKPAYVDLVELLAVLQDQGAKPFGGGEYVYVCPPQVHASLLQDPDWKASHQFMPDPIYKGEVGMLASFRVVNSNAPAFAATSQATVGAANKVYSSFALGRAAYQITDLQSIEAIPTPPGGSSDPLKQSFKLGIKFSVKSVITNQNWIRRIRTAGLNSVNN
jgi:N4-gp56 family major capsid protein